MDREAQGEVPARAGRGLDLQAPDAPAFGDRLGQEPGELRVPGQDLAERPARLRLAAAGRGGLDRRRVDLQGIDLEHLGARRVERQHPAPGVEEQHAALEARRQRPLEGRDAVALRRLRRPRQGRERALEGADQEGDLVRGLGRHRAGAPGALEQGLVGGEEAAEEERHEDDQGRVDPQHQRGQDPEAAPLEGEGRRPELEADPARRRRARAGPADRDEGRDHVAQGLVRAAGPGLCPGRPGGRRRRGGLRQAAGPGQGATAGVEQRHPAGGRGQAPEVLVRERPGGRFGGDPPGEEQGLAPALLDQQRDAAPVGEQGEDREQHQQEEGDRQQDHDLAPQADAAPPPRPPAHGMGEAGQRPAANGPSAAGPAPSAASR
jgi:hypothetical protein